MSDPKRKVSAVDTSFMQALRERYPNMPTGRINAIGDVINQARPGDILATHFGDTKMSWKDWLGVRGFEQFSGTPQHLAMFVDDKGTVVGASEKGGVREVPAYREMSRADDVGISVLRPKTPLTQTQAMKAVDAARAQVGTPFGSDHWFRLANTSWMPKGLANKLSPDICDGPACSTLVADSYDQAGRGLKGLNPHAATPSDFLANDFEVIAKSGERSINRPFFGRAASPLAKAFKYGVVPAGLASAIYAMNRPTLPAQKTSSIQKSSVATFLSSLANAARPGQTLGQAIRQNAGIATTASSVFSPFVYGAAEAAGGGMEAHAIGQLANFGTAGAQASAGTLLGHFGKNTAFVKRLLERANRAKKVQPPAGGVPGVEEVVRQKQSDVSTELRPHQERILRRILAEDQPGLVVAHGLGSGKTLSAIAAAEGLGGDTVVALPASLKANFEKELDKHLSDPVRANYLLESIQGIGRRKKIPAGDTLIIDEAHRLRNPESKTRQFVRKKAEEYAKRLLLTATPVYNKPSDIAGPINIAAAESVLPASPSDFNQKYVGEELVQPGWFAKTFKGIKPGIRKKIINEKELSDVFSKWVDFQRNSTEGFPERIDETVNVPMTDRQLEVYNYMLNEGPAWLKHKIRKGLPPSKQESKSLNTFLTGTRHVSTTPHSYVEGMTEEEAIENAPKIRAAFDRFRQRLSENPEHRAVVYANFLDGLGHYQKLLKDEGVPYGVFTGKEKKRDRDQAIKDYNAGKLKALFVSSAGGEGLDLKGTRQIQVLEPHFNEEKLEQVIGRGIRYGSHAHLPEEQRNVTVEKFLATLPQRKGLMRLIRGKDQGGSVDQYLAQLAADKKLVADQLTGLMEEATARHKTSMKMTAKQLAAALKKTPLDTRIQRLPLPEGFTLPKLSEAQESVILSFLAKKPKTKLSSDESSSRNFSPWLAGGLGTIAGGAGGLLIGDWAGQLGMQSEINRLDKLVPKLGEELDQASRSLGGAYAEVRAKGMPRLSKPARDVIDPVSEVYDTAKKAYTKAVKDQSRLSRELGLRGTRGSMIGAPIGALGLGLGAYYLARQRQRKKLSFSLPEFNEDNVATGIGALAGAALFARGGHRLGAHLRRARMTRALAEFPGIKDAAKAHDLFSQQISATKRLGNRITGPTPLAVGGGVLGGTAAGFGVAAVDSKTKGDLIRGMMEIHAHMEPAPPALSEKDVEDQLRDARDAAANRDDDYVNAMSELDNDLYSSDLSAEEEQQMQAEAEQEVEDLLRDGFADFDQRLKSSSLGSFGTAVMADLKKESARAGVRQLRALFESGDKIGFNNLTRKLDRAGALKRTPMGTQISHLGAGKEGLATLTVGASSAPVGKPSVRKVFDPDSPLASKEGRQGMMAVKRVAKNNPEISPGLRFADTYTNRLERSPGGLRYTQNEYVPYSVGAMPDIQGPINPKFDPFIVGDIRADNVRRTFGGAPVITDFSGVARKQFPSYHASISGDWVSPENYRNRAWNLREQANRMFINQRGPADLDRADRMFFEAMNVEDRAVAAQKAAQSLSSNAGARFEVNQDSLLRRLGPRRKSSGLKKHSFNLDAIYQQALDNRSDSTVSTPSEFASEGSSARDGFQENWDRAGRRSRSKGRALLADLGLVDDYRLIELSNHGATDVAGREAPVAALGSMTTRKDIPQALADFQAAIDIATKEGTPGVFDFRPSLSSELEDALEQAYKARTRTRLATGAGLAGVAGLAGLALAMRGKLKVSKKSPAWQRKEGQSEKGGLNEKGRASLRAEGKDIKAPVTAKAAKKSPEKAKRRKSFCARMGGMEGPMKDEKGRPTRKAKALRRWDC